MTALLRYLVREELKKTAVRDLAKRVGVSHPIILDIEKGTHALSKSDTVEKLAEAFQIPMSDIYARAAAFAAEHPDLVAEEGGTPLPAYESRVAYDPRYPNFAEAARITMQAVEGARASLKSHGDLSVADWLEEIRSEQRRLAAQARDAVGTAAKAEAAAKAAEEQRKADEARIAAGQTGTGDFRKRVAELTQQAQAEEQEPARRSMVPSTEPDARSPRKPKK